MIVDMTLTIRALREAAQALRRVSASSPVGSAEQTLFGHLAEMGYAAKRQEESDPATFAKKVESHKPNLFRYSADKKVYEVNRQHEGLVNRESTPAGLKYENALKACSVASLNAEEVLSGLFAEPLYLNFSGVDANFHVPLVQYHTPGPAVGVLDMALVLPLVQAAKTEPGAIERVESALREKGISWSGVDARGAISDRLSVSGCEGKWVAALDVNKVGQAIADQLSQVSMDAGPSECPAWWSAASASDKIPNPILGLVRGQQASVVVLRTNAEPILSWASSLPGWYASTRSPIHISNVTADQVLGGL